MKVAGIDPGVHGAVAIYRDGITGVDDLPVEDGRLDPVALGHLIRWCDRVVIEDNRAVGSNGSIANFSMGYSIGLIVGVTQTMGIALHRVKPIEWQRAMGLGNVAKTERKDASRQRAREIFPGLAEQLTRKADHNRAEALLIMEYGRRQP